MVICLFGESCTGKSTIAGKIKARIGAKIFTGKDWVKLAKSEPEAKHIFVELLKTHELDNDLIIYVITEKEHLALLPERATKILVTAELSVIKERFAKRMNGNLPVPVAAALEKKHGMFDGEKHDLLIVDGEEPLSAVCDKIISFYGV